MNIMSRRMAIQTVSRYVCSNCWGRLEQFPAPDGTGHVVQCLTCKDETRGFVSQHYADTRRTSDHFESQDVRRLLTNMGIMPRLSAPKSEGQNLRDLGF